MKPRILLFTMAVLCVVYANPFTSLSRACTTPTPEPAPAPVPVTLIPHSPTRISIIINGLTKSTPPGAPADGCACAFRIPNSIKSILAIQFVKANGDSIPSTDWSWGPATASAASAWNSSFGSGSWAAFKGCNCNGVTAGTAFGIRFLAAVNPGTSVTAIRNSLLSASALLGTDTTNDFNGSGSPSNGSHQNFWSASSVSIQESAAIVPTVSEWGLISMGLLTFTAGTIMYGRWRRVGA